MSNEFKPKTIEQYCQHQANIRMSGLAEHLANKYIKDQGIESHKIRAMNKYKKTDQYKVLVQETADKDEKYQKYINGVNSPEVQAEYEKYVEVERRKFEERQEQKRREQETREKEKRLIAEFRDFLDNINLERLVCQYSDEIVEEIIDDLKWHFSQDQLVIEDPRKRGWDQRYRWSRCSYEDRPLTLDNINEFISDFCESLEMDVESAAGLEDFYLDTEVYDRIMNSADGELIKEYTSANPEMENDYEEEIIDEINDAFSGTDPYSKISEYFTPKVVRMLIDKNPYHQNIRKSEEEKLRIGQSILERIPENPIDLFPLARQMSRHFVLHIGPTNSGKTHDALEMLKAAPTGAYFAPLRLLAAECADLLNDDNVPCSMITGEEVRIVEGAKHRASTVELMDPMEKLDLAVIDEGQMISDEQRGWAWTFAILGVRAKEIHICAAPEAEEILKKLIDLCSDTYEIIHHNRAVPLKVEDRNFHFPEDVKAHDALIVFSKRNVLAVAAELKEKDIPCSVIYGSLPYEVRRSEVDRFVSGETKVVIATDAIGMGMNLPIQRVVFLESKKFDGKEQRDLKSEEILQIAGRAGRQGIYDEGLCNAEYSAKFIRNAFKRKPTDIPSAYLGFPEMLVNVEGPLSKIMENWIAMKDEGVFKKANLEVQLRLCKALESYTIDKRLIYSFITIPFDDNDMELYRVWKEAFFLEKSGKHLRFVPLDNLENKSLDELESSYRYCDLMYFYLRRFTDGESLDEIMACKSRISSQIISILKSKGYSKRKCRECGKPLPWNYPYQMCQDCHDRMYPPRRSYYDWDDDFDDDYDYDDIF